MKNYFILAILTIGGLAMLARLMSATMQGFVPGKADTNLIPFLLIFTAIAALLSNLKDVTELLQRFLPPQGPAAADPVSRQGAPGLDQRNRSRMLEKVQAIWIKGVLERAFNPSSRIPLSLLNASGAVILPFNIEVQDVNHPPKPLAAERKMIDVFDQMGGALLILGGPGSGKTTLLLELARDLIRRAQQDAHHGVPIVLNLSSWAYKRQPISQWMIEEMCIQYHIPSKIAASWLAADALLFLLDGLDEVSPEHRLDCVNAINAYRQKHGFVQLAVCSRQADYDMLTGKLRLSGAVVVQPLRLQQAITYLRSQGPQLASLCSMVSQDPVLQELAQTPLMLSIIAQTFEGGGFPEPNSLAASVGDWQNHLFTTYVHRMLSRRGARAQYGEQQTRRWLVILARKMKEHHATFFALEELQQTWLGNHRQILMYEQVVASLGFIVVAIALIPFHIIYARENLYGWLRSSIALLVFGGLSSYLSWYLAVLTPIQCIAGVRWIWRSFGKGLINLPMFQIVWAILAGFGFAIFKRSLGVGLGVFMMLFLMLSLWNGFVEAVDWSKDVSQSASPNARMHKTRSIAGRTIMLLTPLWAGIGGLVGFYAHTLGFTNSDFVWLIPHFGSHSAAMALGGSMVWLSLGLVLAFFISGAHVPARHFCLRALMACYGLAPLAYVRFLDYCDERLILSKVGGSYCFSHRLLLDYFASLPVLPAEAGRLDHATEMIKSRQRLLAVGIFGRQEIHFSIAMLLLAQGELRAAEKHLQESRSLHRNDAFEENTLLGVLAWQQGQRDAAGLCFTAALNIYETSKQINREKSRILEYRAMALLGLGRIDAAEASLQKAIASSELHLNEIDDQHDHLLPWQLLEESNPAPAGLDRLMALLPER